MQLGAPRARPRPLGPPPPPQLPERAEPPPKSPIALLLAVQERDERECWEEIAARLDLTHLIDREVQALSGGELQRFAIASSAVRDADCYMFDEASSFLDIKQRMTATTARSKGCCPPWQPPSRCWPPVPPQRAPGGSAQLGTPRARPSHWAFSHRLGGSSEPPPKSPIPPPLTAQA